MSSPIRWHGEEMCEIDSHCWTSGYDLKPVYLGKSEDILPVLRGEKEIPAETHPTTKRLLVDILEELNDGRAKESTGTPDLSRASGNGVARDRAKSPRYIKERKRPSLHKTR